MTFYSFKWIDPSVLEVDRSKIHILSFHKRIKLHLPKGIEPLTTHLRNVFLFFLLLYT